MPLAISINKAKFNKEGYVRYVRYHRFTDQLKPIASFLDASGASGSSRWLRGALPR